MQGLSSDSSAPHRRCPGDRRQAAWVGFRVAGCTTRSGVVTGATLVVTGATLVETSATLVETRGFWSKVSKKRIGNKKLSNRSIERGLEYLE